MIFALATATPAVLVLAALTWMTVRLLVRRKREAYLLRHATPEKTKQRKLFIVGFFHPYCHAGGGGERVLWTALKAIQDEYPEARCVVYTGDVGVSSAEFVARVRERFGLNIDQSTVDFIHLHRRWLVDEKTYPHLTLLMQSLGSIGLGVEAFWHLAPHVFIDTMGYAFTYPLFKWLGACRVVAYVHYPVISSDMLSVVADGRATFNNRAIYAQRPLYRYAKLAYYQAFAWLYGFVGRRADVVMVNSTWTKNHVVDIWRLPERTRIVYPPCDTSAFAAFPLHSRDNIIISIGQFRPEKNHPLQLHSFKRFLDKTHQQDIKLVIIGGARNSEDLERVRQLKLLAGELGLKKHVTFEVNLPYALLKTYLHKAKVGLHTMINEHFGISIVEYMAAGCLAVAHRSGGPLSDIVGGDGDDQRLGWLADSEETYAEAFRDIFERLDEHTLLAAQERARRAAVQRFSEQRFTDGFMNAIAPTMTSRKHH